MSSTIPKTQKVILFEENGEIDVLQYKNFPVPTIADDEILVKNKYAGVNYIESYFRTGIYPSEKPYVLGREASGVVAAIGKEVKTFKVGDKVSYLSGSTFAQYTKAKASSNIYNLADDINEKDLQIMGSVLIQGLTAITFGTLAYPISKGDYILVYAAAGGVGQILVQLCKQKGAHAIAIASSQEKLELAKTLGAEYFINNKTDDIVAKVLEFTNGKGVIAAYDSIGKDTYEITSKCLGVNARFVSFGNATGKVPPISINTLPKNSSIMRPNVVGYLQEPGSFKYYMDILWNSYKNGDLKFNIYKTLPLGEYKEAARLLESRVTTGKISLEIPQ